MSNRLHLVATCTDRKTVAPASELRIRDLRKRSSHRPDVDEWVRRREEDCGDAVEARDLYQGELWSATLKIMTAGRATDRDVQLWIVSAGYGLVPADTPLRPYAATFSANSPDAVCRSRPAGQVSLDRREWWRDLSAAGPASQPRTLEDLAGEVADDDLLLVMGRAYLDACRDDLDRTRRVHERAVLMTTGDVPPDDEEWVPRYDARVQGDGPLPGSRISLNAHVARHLIESLDGERLTRERAQDIVSELMADLPEAPSYSHRRSVTDDEVRSFARRVLDEDATVSATRALRRLRDDEQRACEQRRFGRLFAEVKHGLQEGLPV